MVEAGLKPVYVFDGKPPKMKSHELAKRKERGRIFLLFVSIESLNSSNKKANLYSWKKEARDKAKEDLEEAKEVGTATEVDKQERRLVKVTKEHVAECKRLLDCMGIPYVEAETEAEAQVFIL